MSLDLKRGGDGGDEVADGEVLVDHEVLERVVREVHLRFARFLVGFLW